MGTTTSGISTAPSTAVFSYFRKNAFLFVVVSSLTLAFFVGQDDEIEKGSIFYFLVILPFLLVPLLEISTVISNLLTRVLLVTIFSITSASWLGINDQVAAGFQLIFWAYILAYLSGKNAVIDLEIFAKIFVFLIIFGFAVDVLTNINHYGVLISKNYYINESHRLSLYPNIANSGFFAFVFLIFYTVNLKVARKYWWVLTISILIVMASKVRSIQIALLMYIGFRFFLEKNKKLSVGLLLFLCGALSVISLLITSSYELLYQIAANNDFLLNFLFRGVESLSEDDLSGQVYRPVVWASHWEFFKNSSFLLGVGPEKLTELVAENLTYGDSVSFLSRYLALYGLPCILFFLQIAYWLLNRAYQTDLWACALFPSIFFLMMSWGSIFHPSNGFAILLLLVLLKGRNALKFQKELQ